MKHYIAEHAQRFNSALYGALEGLLAGVPAELAEAIEYPLKAGGKRLRPVLCLAAGGLAGGGFDDVFPAAAALEMVHTYSLVHDDLPAMDNDDLRRGLPTVHVKYGEATAVLVGDALLTMAFEMLAGCRLPAERRTALAAELAAAAGPGGMIAGQAMDLAGEGRADGTLEDVLGIHTHKTARLITAAVRMGVLAAGGGAELLGPLTVWGERAGLAFQVADDVLDATSTPEELGKSVGKDAAGGKLTAVAVLGTDGAAEYARRLASEASEAVSGVEGAEIFGDLAALFVHRSR
ncbi:MAG: polyprenyl synthetase family protein [Planctomycetes bacterium]|nr:polyprenyl synthetase family protein [Planctomycetota bacterium]